MFFFIFARGFFISSLLVPLYFCFLFSGVLILYLFVFNAVLMYITMYEKFCRHISGPLINLVGAFSS